MNHREIDRLVAEKVFGYRITTFNKHVESTVRIPDTEIVLLHDGGYTDLPKYSERIEDAWRVVEKLKGEYVLSLYQIREKYRVDFEDKYRSSHYANDSNAPMAICKAALKTKRIEVDIDD